MKAVQLLINSVLPEDLRDYARSYDAKSINDLMAAIGHKYPDRYAELAQKISDIGRNASYAQGETLTLEDLKPVVDRDAVFREMDAAIAQAKKTTKTPKEFKARRLEIWHEYAKRLEDMTAEAGLERGTNLAYSVMSGARGKPAQLKMMVTTPGLFADYKDDTIPLFVRNSYGDGLRPAEYLASTFGARKSVISTKSSTAKGGDLCLHEDTLVRMSDFSVKRIKDIRVGDWVIGADKNGNTFPVEVTAVFNQGLRPVWEWNVAVSGSSKKAFSFQSTKTHKFLRAQKKYSGAFVNDVTAIEEFNTRSRFPIIKNFDDSGKVSEPWALLLGMLTGDGGFASVKPKSRVTFTCADALLISDVTHKAAELGVKFTQRKDQPIQYRVSVINFRNKTGKRDGYQHPVKRILHKEKLIGLKAWEKRPPDNIHKWDNSSVLQYVAGFLATDGCITSKTAGGKSYPYISFSGTSKAVLQCVKDLLFWRFGIFGSALLEIPPEKCTGFAANHTSYVFHLSTSQSQRLLSLVDIPGVKGILAKSLFPSITFDHGVAQGDFNLLGGEYLGELPCYDIEVNHPDHLFVLACGIITSNSKQAIQATAAITVTEKDCGVNNGIDLTTEDDLRGRVLARPAGNLPAGTILTRANAARLRQSKVKDVLVRSALTCQAQKGICAMCAGADPRGILPKKGESVVGITASQAITEPVTQGALSMKHTGGVAGAKKEYSGFDVINQIMQSPETFPDRAAVAELDGTVQRVEEAPQGGNFVIVDEERHYVPPGYDILVKPGDKVEAGDQLSDGIVDVGDIVRLRGLGEGRRYYSERVKKALDDSGMAANLRNTEILARAAINHVNIDDVDGLGDYLPDDIADYNRLSTQYSPPETARMLPVKKAVGQYLQGPALHYSIGTRITPKIAQRLESKGFPQVVASPDEPGFTPSMVRLRAAGFNQPGWFAKLHTSYLKDNLVTDAIRGTDENFSSNTHFAPRLAVGEGFGDKAETTGEF